MRIALIQMTVTADKAGNLQTACEKLREAAAHGADIAVLPEMFCCPYQNDCFRAYGEGENGPAQPALSGLAAEPIFFNICPPFPMIIPLWDSLSQMMVASIWQIFPFSFMLSIQTAIP